METYTDRINELQSLFNDIQNTKTKIANEIKKSTYNEWLSLGGCTTCQGTGSRVVWDTMDVMDGSCAEYGPCDNKECTQEKRNKSGINITYVGKYFRSSINRNIIMEKIEEQTKIFNPKLNELRNKIYELANSCKEFKKGDTVVVKKGKKVPIGTVGKIFYMKATEYGLNVGFKDNNETVYWNYGHNLDIVIT